MKNRIAAEQKSIETALAEIPQQEKYVKIKFARLRKVCNIPPEASVLDIGTAQGTFLIACGRMGYKCFGVEPWGQARRAAKELSKMMSVNLEIFDGTAEKLPFGNSSFDVVHANSVMEHVVDINASLTEIYRVLKVGGVFWFNSASCMCPLQNEISGFPFFAWYPQALKLKILYWAKSQMPQLIGNTEFPAIHWFTPWKARRLLNEHGFSMVYDRWDLRQENEGGCLCNAILPVIKSSMLTKIAADVLMPGCSYAAIK